MALPWSFSEQGVNVFNNGPHIAEVDLNREVRRCFICQGYGHVQVNCRAKEPICRKYSGPIERKKECLLYDPYYPMEDGVASLISGISGFLSAFQNSLGRDMTVIGKKDALVVQGAALSTSQSETGIQNVNPTEDSHQQTLLCGIESDLSA